MALNPINIKIYKKLPNRFTSRHVREITKELQPHLSEHQLKKAAANFCNKLKTQRHIKIVEIDPEEYVQMLYDSSNIGSFYKVYAKLTPAEKLKSRVSIDSKTLLKKLPLTFTQVDVFNLLKDRGAPAGEFYLDRKLWNSVRVKISNWKKDYQVKDTGKKKKIITPLGKKEVTSYKKISEKNSLPPQKQSETPATSTSQTEDDLKSSRIEHKKKMADTLRGGNPNADKKEDSHETIQESEYQEFEYTLELGDCDSTVVNNGNLYLGNLKISGTFTVTPLKK